MSKRIRIALIGLTIITLMWAGIVYAAEPITMVVNGKTILSDTPAQIMNGRTMVPVKFVAEALGAKVQWDEKTNTVNIEKEKSIATPLIKLNGEQTTWPYWYENGVLYLEYRNTVQLIKEYNPHPSYVVKYFKDNDMLMIGNKNLNVPYKNEGDFRIMSINYLQEQHIINYTWDHKTGNLTTIPIQ